MKPSRRQQGSLAAAAILISGLAGCGGSSGPLIPPVPRESPSVATYKTAAALAYAVACNDVRPANKSFFPGTPQEVVACNLNNSPVLLATYATVSGREAASKEESSQLSGTGPNDVGIVDGANWIVSGHNSVLSTVTFRIHGDAGAAQLLRGVRLATRPSGGSGTAHQTPEGHSEAQRWQHTGGHV